MSKEYKVQLSLPDGRPYPFTPERRIEATSAERALGKLTNLGDSEVIVRIWRVR